MKLVENQHAALPLARVRHEEEWWYFAGDLATGLDQLHGRPALVKLAKYRNPTTDEAQWFDYYGEHVEVDR